MNRNIEVTAYGFEGSYVVYFHFISLGKTAGHAPNATQKYRTDGLPAVHQDLSATHTILPL